MRQRLSACLTLALLIWASERAQAQCAGQASTPEAAADCAARGIPQDKIATLDPARRYTLAELVDIAEHNNPRTRVAWELAKQKADQLGVARSAYYPILAALASFSDQRILEPFPKPLSPVGYSLFELPTLQPEVEIEYTIFDFGRRAAKVDAATAEKLASGANFIQINQEVAFRVSVAYYNLLTAQERLQAAQETLKTDQTTQDASEAQLNNGRATLPDVLNARAETAQSQFDLEAADGDEKIARVTLTEAIGVEPSPNIAIDGQENVPLPGSLAMSIDALIDRALAGRPESHGASRGNPGGGSRYPSRQGRISAQGRGFRRCRQHHFVAAVARRSPWFHQPIHLCGVSGCGMAHHRWGPAEE